MEEKLQEIINSLLMEANKEVINDYKDLAPNIKHKLMMFGKQNIEYFYSKNSETISKKNPNTLYINYDSFMENNQFSTSKIEQNKKLIIQTYIKKIVLEGRSDIRLNPYKTNEEEIQDFINRHNFKIQEEQEKKTENTKEIIAKNYNIPLNNINTLIINEHIYYKFIKDGRPKMIETLTDNELESPTYQQLSKEEIQNNLEQKKIQITLIPIYELPQHQREIESLSKEQIEKLQTILKQQKKLKITHINLSNGIAIKENGECVYAEKNKQGEYEVKSAEKKDNITNENNLQQEQTELENEYNIQQELEDKTENNNKKQKVLTLNYNNKGFSNILILSLITSFVGGIILTILFTLIK